MFSFFFKKNFFDAWDNLFHIVLVNLVYIAFVLVFLSLGIFFIAPHSQEAVSSIYNFFFVILICLVFSIFIFSEGKNASVIANYKAPKFVSFFTEIPSTLKVSVPFGILTGLLVNIAFVSLPYYFNMWASAKENSLSFVYLFFMALIFWFLVVTVLAFQWFVPVNALLHDGFIKCLKKSYIMLFDNLGFTLLLFLVNVLNLLLTVFTMGITGNFSTVLITNTNALRLRLYKYDWQEVNPELSAKELKNVPWEELLRKDKATVGDRTLKSLFKPWK